MMQHTIIPAESQGKLAAKIKSGTPDLRTSDILHILKKIIFGSQNTHWSCALHIFLHTGEEVIKEGTTNPPNGTTIQCWYKRKNVYQNPESTHRLRYTIKKQLK